MERLNCSKIEGSQSCGGEPPPNGHHFAFFEHFEHFALPFFSDSTRHADAPLDGVSVARRGGNRAGVSPVFWPEVPGWFRRWRCPPAIQSG